MKKKILATFLVTLMVVTTITGCGKKEEETKTVVENQAQQESAASTTENVVEDSKDWSKAYTEYFKTVEDHISKENTLTVMDATTSGFNMKIEVASLSDLSYMAMDVGTFSIDLYGYSDKVYACSNLGDADIWQFTPVNSREEANALTEGSSSTPVIDNTACEYKGYKEETTIDGKVYDVLEASYNNEGAPLDVLVYVERDTQKLRKMESINSEVEKFVVDIKDITEITLPAEAANATECTGEDLAGTLMAVMFGGMMGDTEGGSFEFDMNADITFDGEITEDGDVNVDVNANATVDGEPIKITVYN